MELSPETKLNRRELEAIERMEDMHVAPRTRISYKRVNKRFAEWLASDDRHSSLVSAEGEIAIDRLTIDICQGIFGFKNRSYCRKPRRTKSEHCWSWDTSVGNFIPAYCAGTLRTRTASPFCECWVSRISSDPNQ